MLKEELAKKKRKPSARGGHDRDRMDDDRHRRYGGGRDYDDDDYDDMRMGGYGDRERRNELLSEIEDRWDELLRKFKAIA